MASIDVNAILAAVGGPKGLPFPGSGSKGEAPSVIASGYDSIELPARPTLSQKGTKLWSTNNLGALVFMPVFFNGVEIPNALISITGEKGIVEEDIIGAGTVFETIYQRPYDITIIATVFGENGEWPEQAVKDLIQAWEQQEVLTLDCALTDNFLNASQNFLLTKISLPDMQGIENCQVVQFDGRSNIEFELEIL